ncbi:MAG: response regulator [Chloroflexi bacterium]|nr:response regulator [Chloroflexota bacterium]
MFESSVSAPIEILMIEDNPGDVRLTREVLGEASVHNSLVAVKDGEEAMNYLYKRGSFADAARPDLILLDLNLPKMSGLEILQKIKSDKDLRSIPVVILTSSQAEHDILAGYDAYANAYITKPVSLDQFNRIVLAIEGFWLETVRLPRQSTES